MNCTRHELQHCYRERMHKCDTSTLTSRPDQPAGLTRTAALQKIHRRHQSAGISKTIALSASQVVAPLFLHYTWCACRHRSSIGQVHHLPSGSDGTRVVHVATLLNPLCARLQCRCTGRCGALQGNCFFTRGYSGPKSSCSEWLGRCVSACAAGGAGEPVDRGAG
jgi:hypothetical protein